MTLKKIFIGFLKYTIGLPFFGPQKIAELVIGQEKTKLHLPAMTGNKEKPEVEWTWKYVKSISDLLKDRLELMLNDDLPPNETGEQAADAVLQFAEMAMAFQVDCCEDVEEDEHILDRVFTFADAFQARIDERRGK